MAVPPTTPRLELRTAMRSRRAAFVAGLSASGRAALETALVTRLEPLLSGRTCVAGYAALGSEIDAASLGFSLWPRVVADDRPLSFHIASVDELAMGTGWGLREPLASAPVAVPDAVLVPLLAADARGYRLGYGKGHYDRALAGLGALRIGVAWDCQVVDRVPEETWDEALDWLVTPTRTIRCSAGRCDSAGDGAGVGAAAPLG